MNGSLIIASYAAIVATASVVWQVFLWRSERVARLLIEVDAQWALFYESLSISIINQSTYDVPLRRAWINSTGESGLFARDIDLDDFGLTKVVPARSYIEWKFDRELLLAQIGASLATYSQVEIVIYTATGRSESSSVKVGHPDHHSRAMFALDMNHLSDISYGDLVRVRSTSADTTGVREGRTGTITGYSTSDATFQIRFGDKATITVPVADVEPVTKYEDRIKALKDRIRNPR